ncbi:hypothetical protein B0P06_003763 [Clostridium saccharoperbutylacetonicum]|uniref:Dipeptidyl peptidase IV n=1 Tax=Clostridium saccharoperbutylacetonicum N1-4(HMT) TaxID=931276 RepID=M1N397_9CLOT|nr:hypothetical protein [Clostridium saccharoperbutylacetonicum]AGF57927.1 hypothetical protein Cspa_c41740 [Clostridium saccharoperbutylacetonicum N1-4(HMT)]NRT61300.1 hypothetical protein [Clostridium saccharoperbutylacetonicum]NSB24617.1 hypothetical protein [Clostridium saccharoperbutylacetonicum]NSB43992.1 hypothetical protein [Clostridium saccharoperbutylacetonicum]
MKNLVRILAWTLIALVIQHSIFLYIENFYLDSDVKIQAEKVEEKEPPKKANPNEINIKDGINQISVSSDGRFVAYYENNKLKVFDSVDNSEKEFQSEENGEVAFYKWLTNENSIIVIQKVQTNNGAYYEPVSFNAKKGETRELADFNLNELKINITNKNDKVDDVVFSTATHTLYIKIKKGNGKSDLYYANIMNQLEKVRANKDIDDIVVPTTSTNAVMEMGNGVTILNSADNIEIPKVQTIRILGSDINDNVYFGEEVNGKIAKVYYTTLSNTKHQWNSLILPKPVDKADIIIDYSGKVYVNDKTANSVLELLTKKTIKYEGQFLQSYSKGIISKNDNKLIKIEIDQNKIATNK